MAFQYTEEQLNKLDKELLVQLFLGLQEQVGGTYPADTGAK